MATVQNRLGESTTAGAPRPPMEPSSQPMAPPIRPASKTSARGRRPKRLRAEGSPLTRTRTGTERGTMDALQLTTRLACKGWELTGRPAVSTVTRASTGPPLKLRGSTRSHG